MNIQAKAYLANKQQFTSFFESQKILKTASLTQDPQKMVFETKKDLILYQLFAPRKKYCIS